MTTGLESIQIVDESTYDVVRYQLYIDGGRRAVVTKKGDTVELVWQVYGPQYWPQAEVLMNGLLQLSVIADQLSNGKKRK